MRHILKRNWLMYTEFYKVSDMRFNSPLVDKDIYDTFYHAFIGVAIKLTNGKKYVSTKNVFDKNKKEFNGKYYIDCWRIF